MTYCMTLQMMWPNSEDSPCTSITMSWVIPPRYNTNHLRLCRLAEADDFGNVSHILVHPDWKGDVTRAGKRLRVDEKTIKRFPVFNPDRNVVISQIAKVGGIQNYHGQIAWFSMAGRWVYPTPIYDAAITEISTDEGLGNIKYRNARNNFLTSCMLITKKGVQN